MHLAKKLLMSDLMTQQSSTVQSKEARVHLGWLDSLRALAALYVMIGHIFSTVWNPPPHFHGLTLAAVAPFRYGQSAVSLFIVLSGFSLMLPVTRGDGLLRGGAWRFFKRRAKRILPTYYAALGTSLLLVYFFVNRRTGTNWDNALPISRSDVWFHILMLQDILSHGKINNAFWSISVEWRIYFLFPILVILFKKWGGGKTTLGMLGCACLTLLIFQHSIINGITPAFFSLFTMGMLACEISFGDHKRLSKIRDHFPWAILGCPILLIHLAMILKWRANISPVHLFMIEISVGVLWAILLIILSKSGRNLLRVCLSWKPLVFVGTFSYSIYLIHMPLVQILWQYGVHPLGQGLLTTYLLLIFGGIPLILGTSYLFFLAFERPFLNTKKRETMAETARDAALSPAP